MRVLEQYRPSKSYTEKQQDLISVIVTAYNIEDYIARGVRSICAQTYRNLEIIVVDDGSTDSTGQICDALAAEDERVRIIHKQNGGPADARNVGTASSKGHYIGYVDGDDWIDPDMYETMLGALLEQRADMAVCRYRQVYRDHTEDGSADRAVLFEGQEALQYYVEEREEYAIQNAAWNKLYRREILEGASFPVGKWYEDIMFATSALSRAGRCIYLDTAHYNYIIDREGSIMNTQINPRTFTDQVPAYYEKTRFLQELGRQDLARVHDYFFYRRLLLFYYQIYEKMWGQTKEPASEKTRKAQESKKMTHRDKAQQQETYLAEIETILRRDEDRVREAFHDPIADVRDCKKAELFFRSPGRYCRRVQWEERVVIPLKVKVKLLLKLIRQ